MDATIYSVFWVQFTQLFLLCNPQDGRLFSLLMCKKRKAMDFCPVPRQSKHHRHKLTISILIMTLLVSRLGCTFSWKKFSTRFYYHVINKKCESESLIFRFLVDRFHHTDHVAKLRCQPKITEISDYCTSPCRIIPIWQNYNSAK